MNINLLENIIPNDYQDHLEKVLLGNQLPLFLNSKNVDLDNKTAFTDKNAKFSFRLNHSFIEGGQLVSEHWKLIEPLTIEIVKALNIPPKLSSCKLNINFPVNHFLDTDYYPPHYDTTDKGIVAIYYVNNSDGDTLFMDSVKGEDDEFKIVKTLTPKKGALAYFPENVLHTNRPPQQTQARCVINFNFLKDF
jgi:hypothetical protein